MDLLGPHAPPVSVAVEEPLRLVLVGREAQRLAPATAGSHDSRQLVRRLPAPALVPDALHDPP
eukprot:3520680-Alexandrium_andersonii.AAC.1